jgi:vacuolar-type H+-ATPase subunit H
MTNEEIIASLEKALTENKTLFFNALSQQTADRAEAAIKSIENRLEKLAADRRCYYCEARNKKTCKHGNK